MWILRSYRWRRRLIIWTIVLGIAGPLIYLGVRYSHPPKQPVANGGTVPDYVTPKHARFTARKRREVHKVLKQFIKTAVARRDVGGSWDVTAPSLRQGFTRKQWANGNIPVVPYPAANHGLGNWSYVESSYTNSVMLEVNLFPKKGSGYSDMSADVELVRGKDGSWRVDYWMPKQFHGPPSLSAKGKAKAAAAKAQAGAKARARHAKSAQAAKRSQPKAAVPPVHNPQVHDYWWAVPVAVLSLAILLPILIGLGLWWRNRRIERDYLRSAS